jgi:hypothetical protein
MGKHVALELMTVLQIGIYHHVTGVDASSSASLAAYINTLTYREHGPNATTKISAGLYWYGLLLRCLGSKDAANARTAVTMPFQDSICEYT